MPVTVIDSVETFKTATGGDKIAIIDFWATWCGPWYVMFTFASTRHNRFVLTPIPSNPTSKVIGPVFEKLSDQFDNIGFFKCDVDSQEEVAAEVGIKAMPTFLLFKNGEQIGKVVGADPNKLRDAIKHHSENSA
ncbi:hypothetical protein JCM11491_003549 [Sporobolomyces phaffii]